MGFSQGQLQSGSNCSCFPFSSERVRVLISAAAFRNMWDGDLSTVGRSEIPHSFSV